MGLPLPTRSQSDCLSEWFLSLTEVCFSSIFNFTYISWNQSFPLCLSHRLYRLQALESLGHGSKKLSHILYLLLHSSGCRVWFPWPIKLPGDWPWHQCPGGSWLVGKHGFLPQLPLRWWRMSPMHASLCSMWLSSDRSASRSIHPIPSSNQGTIPFNPSHHLLISSL